MNVYKKLKCFYRQINNIKMVETRSMTLNKQMQNNNNQQDTLRLVTGSMNYTK